jgi:hypothetical protein
MSMPVPMAEKSEQRRLEVFNSRVADRQPNFGSIRYGDVRIRSNDQPTAKHLVKFEGSALKCVAGGFHDVA